MMCRAPLVPLPPIYTVRDARRYAISGVGAVRASEHVQRSAAPARYRGKGRPKKQVARSSSRPASRVRRPTSSPPVGAAADSSSKQQLAKQRWLPRPTGKCALEGPFEVFTFLLTRSARPRLFPTQIPRTRSPASAPRAGPFAAAPGCVVCVSAGIRHVIYDRVPRTALRKKRLQ